MDRLSAVSPWSPAVSRAIFPESDRQHRAGGSSLVPPLPDEFRMRRIAPLLFALLCATPPARAAAQAQPDSARGAATEAFGWILYVGFASNVLFEWDPDEGGYRDTFSTIDKQLHAAVGYGFTQAAITAGVRPRDAVIGVSAAAVAWELSQEYSSWRDIVASVAGSLAAWAWHDYWERHRSRRRS